MLESQLQLFRSSAIVSATKDSQVFSEVKARQLTIIDDLRVVRCQIGINEQNATQLTLHPSGVAPSIIMGASDNISAVGINDFAGTQSNNARILLSQSREYGPSVTIAHLNGKPGFSAQVIDGASLIGLSSSHDGVKPQVEIRVGKEQEATVLLSDAKHNGRAIIGVTQESTPSIGLIDRKGVGRISLSLDASDVPAFLLHDNMAKTRGSFSMGRSGDVGLFSVDVEGNIAKISK